MKKLISVVTPCYNEEENVVELYRQIKEVFARMPDYDYEHIYIDNASQDSTVSIVKSICLQDPRVKLIVNSRNFGHIRSPIHGLLQARGDAVILMVSDLQDPPNMIKDFVEAWEKGFKIVLGIKADSEESASMFAIRRLYYRFISRISDIELTRNNTGFGLYDKQVIQIMKEINDPYPYFRGLISDIGFESYKINYKQPSRKRGITKNNFYTLYDMAMLGITNHSKIPLRLATMFGFGLSFISLFVAFVYFLLKLIFWNSIPFGIAPLVIGMFFFASVQLFFIGMIGEYVGAVHTQVLKRPLVIEKERVNFNKESVSNYNAS